MPRPIEIAPRRSIIPPTTFITLLRKGSALLRSTPLRPTVREQDCSERVAGHVYKKPGSKQRRMPVVFEEGPQGIKWETDIIPNHNGAGDLGIILQFHNIDLISSFTRGSVTMDLMLLFSIVQPVITIEEFWWFFRHIPSLMEVYDAKRMTVRQNNGVVTVGYPLVI